MGPETDRVPWSRQGTHDGVWKLSFHPPSRSWAVAPSPVPRCRGPRGIACSRAQQQARGAAIRRRCFPACLGQEGICRRSPMRLSCSLLDDRAWTARYDRVDTPCCWRGGDTGERRRGRWCVTTELFDLAKLPSDSARHHFIRTFASAACSRLPRHHSGF